MDIQSEKIDELVQALAPIQARLTPVLKTDEVKAGPKRYKFAPLSDVWAALRAELPAAGIAVLQLPHVLDGEPVLVTVLAHRSGQWMRSVYKLQPTSHDPQSMGSAITYARRYSLCAAVGVVTDDDDGLQASGYPAPQWAPPPPPMVELPLAPAPELPPPPAATGDYVSPPAVAQAEAVAHAAVATLPQNDNDTKLANLRSTLAQSNVPELVFALVEEARRILPGPLADTFAGEARPRWEALSAQAAA